MVTAGFETRFRFGGHLAEDSEGRLYDRRTREQLRRSPALDDPRGTAAAEAVRALVVTTRALRYTGERWAQRFGLSEIRLQLLLLVRHHPEEQLTLGQLARALDLSPRTVTGLVDLLERDCLVTRVPHDTDRRSIRVRLTAAGRDKVDAVWGEVFSRHSPLFEDFSVEEMAQLRHLAYRLLVNLARSEG